MHSFKDKRIFLRKILNKDVLEIDGLSGAPRKPWSAQRSLNEHSRKIFAYSVKIPRSWKTTIFSKMIKSALSENMVMF